MRYDEKLAYIWVYLTTCCIKAVGSADTFELIAHSFMRFKKYQESMADVLGRQLEYRKDTDKKRVVWTDENDK
jgi:hypothetical protein